MVLLSFYNKCYYKKKATWKKDPWKGLDSNSINDKIGAESYYGGMSASA